MDEPKMEWKQGKIAATLDFKNKDNLPNILNELTL